MKKYGLTFQKGLLCFSILLGMVLKLHAPLAAQEPEPKFTHVFDLDASGLQTFHQDQEGFLWFGTKGSGLFRYDGYELKNYGVGSGELSNGYIYGLVGDLTNSHILWIGTKGGLNRLDKRTQTYSYYQYNPYDHTSLSNNGINTMIQDSINPNWLWVGSDGGLDRFDKETGTFTRYAPDPADPDSLRCPQVWYVIEDTTDPNILWIATWGCGLHRFDKQTEQFTAYLHDPGNTNSLSAENNIIPAIAQDKDTPHILWIGTIDNGLDRFDTRAEIFTHYVHDPQDPTSLTTGLIGLIYDNGQGTLWIGGWIDDNGLTLFDKTTGTFRNYKHVPGDPTSLSDDQIVNVTQDRAGSMWIVGFSGKVDKFDPQEQNFTLYQHTASSNSLVHNAVTSLYEDSEGQIWLGTQSGMSKFNQDTETFTNYAYNPDDAESLRADQIWDIEEGAEGDLWLSYMPGPLSQFNRQTGKVIAAYQNGVESFLEIIQDPDDPNLLWVTSRPHYFSKFDKTTKTFTSYQVLPSAAVEESSLGFFYVGLHDREEAVIWLGGWEGGGLIRFDKQTQTFTRYLADPDNPTSLSSDAIAAFYQDTSGALWIGTLGGGLEKFDKASETFTHYAESHNVPAVVNAILEDDAVPPYLWLSTDQGIVKFNPRTETIENSYTAADGLQGDAFLLNSALKTRTGELWFGGVNGVNRFLPSALVTNPYVPPIVLTALTQGNTPVYPDLAPEYIETVTLDWRQNFFEFEFVALNYTKPEKNQYAYKLEDVDKDWYIAGSRRFGRYTGLLPGHYTLHIKGSNNDGVWNDQGLSIPITVKPPFWKTWWFYTISTTGILGVIGAIAWSREQKLRAERAAVETLRQSEERLRQVVQNMPVLLGAFDENHHLLVWNRESERVTGYNADEMLHNPQALELLYPDPEYHEYILDSWTQEGEDVRNYEQILTAKDGSQKIITWSNISRQFPISGWAEWAIGMDITQQKQAEAELEISLAEIQTQARKVQQIINTVPEGVLLLDAAGHVLLANPEAERCLALLTPPEALLEGITRLGNTPLAELLTSPPTKGLWHEVQAQNAIFEIIARPMHNGSQSEDWVLVIHDVTQERAIEDKIQQQERLAAVGQLAAGIAHDFNNIMATIVLYAQMAVRVPELPKRVREQMHVIDGQAKHAARLIEQILDFSRRSLLELQPLDLLPLIKESVQILKRTLPENINITLTYEPDNYTVKADPTRIQQMVTNLAINARDAMPEGGNLDIAIRQLSIGNFKHLPLPEMQPGEWIEIIMADTGTGIAPEILQHIFEPFFTTKERGRGNGLGLPQVYGIIRAHGGYIDVKTEASKGTQFIIYLPAASNDVSLPVTQEIENLPPGADQLILVVEDNAIARQAIVEGLETLAYRTLVASNGQEALKLLTEYPDEIDLVLSDVVMPTMGGLALVNAMHERHIAIKVILMTGHPLDTTLTDIQIPHIVNWLMKPINLETLAEAIAKALIHT
ncbi:MAG: response regulator [Anaerolineae bacterium]|nr:response regulator [Anaerolineae bacterium]